MCVVRTSACVCAYVFLCGVHVCVSARRCDCDCDCACMLKYVSTHASVFMCAYEYMCLCVHISSYGNNVRL